MAVDFPPALPEESQMSKHLKGRVPVPSRNARSSAANTVAVRSGVRRDELIEVAARVFAAQGYGNTSIQELADQVGLLKGSLYHYIATKEDLLFEVIRSTMVTWQNLVRSTRDADSATLDKLRTYIHNNIEGSLNARERTAVVTHDFQALSPKRQKIILEMRQDHDDLLRELIQKAKEEKLIGADVNVKLVALAILTMSGSLYRWYNPNGELSAKMIAASLTEFVMNGLGAGR